MSNDGGHSNSDVTHDAVFGVDLMLFRNTGSVLFLPWDSENLNPRSPVAGELHARTLKPEGGNNE